MRYYGVLPWRRVAFMLQLLFHAASQDNLRPLYFWCRAPPLPPTAMLHNVFCNSFDSLSLHSVTVSHFSRPHDQPSAFSPWRKENLPKPTLCSEQKIEFQQTQCCSASNRSIPCPLFGLSVRLWSFRKTRLRKNTMKEKDWCLKQTRQEDFV